MSVVSVYCNFANAEEAERIGRIAVEERLAACINIFGPCRSIYRWEGTVRTADEAPAILKTSAARVDALIARVAELHSHVVPAITVLPVERLLADYGDWVERSTC
ncbi:MAG: divalent-cation tolerance protein CutA [Pseudomonadota bacterium]|nr:divalent-cation tolerance protein CutA [Pseudomonadota bacterium]